MMSKSFSDSQCAAETRRSSIRMTSVSHKNREHDLVKKYQSHLESRIMKGDQSLVCRDEKICKEAEMLLTKGSAQKILKLDGLDSLTVMENSLQAFPFKTGHLGLEKISKAFEVLELAALNLYLYPWRKEYKFVKMFSGMFTHLIKPALTLQQARELFGLLGYQPASHNEEELELDSKPVPATFILCLASAFFAARIECQLLLSTLGSVDTSVESVLHLVKERQEGHSLCVALDNAKRKLEAIHALDAKQTELDLYTDENLPQANASHMASTSSPPRSFYMQSNKTLLNEILHRDPTESGGLNKKNSGQEAALYASGIQCQINNSVSLSQNPGPLESIGKEHMAGDPERQTAEVEGVMCSCTTTISLYMYFCENCKNIHRGDCEYYKICKAKKHALVLCSDGVGQQLEKNAPLSKDLLKKHNCMAKSTSDTFLVCHSCQLIHDQKCTNIAVCVLLQHFIQPTGRLQPSVNAPQRHICLTPEAPVYVICSTCNNAHDCLCTQVKNCNDHQHKMQFLQVSGDSETHNTPIVQPTGRLQPTVNAPQRHTCLTPEAPVYVICSTCNNAHDCLCTQVKNCNDHQHKMQFLQVSGDSETHNTPIVQPTGRLQPTVNAPQRHTCLTPEDPVYVICATCNNSHDCLCARVKNCIDHQHEVQFLALSGDSEMHNTPMEFHRCCIANPLLLTKIACLTCKVFHASFCLEICSLNHKIHELRNTCVTCFSHDVSVLCSYCCRQYCRNCWLKNPMLCKCGNPFQKFSSV